MYFNNVFPIKKFHFKQPSVFVSEKENQMKQEIKNLLY